MSTQDKLAEEIINEAWAMASKKDVQNRLDRVPHIVAKVKALAALRAVLPHGIPVIGSEGGGA